MILFGVAFSLACAGRANWVLLGSRLSATERQDSMRAPLALLPATIIISAILSALLAWPVQAAPNRDASPQTEIGPCVTTADASLGGCAAVNTLARKPGRLELAFDETPPKTVKKKKKLQVHQVHPVSPTTGMIGRPGSAAPLDWSNYHQRSNQGTNNPVPKPPRFAGKHSSDCATGCATGSAAVHKLRMQSYALSSARQPDRVLVNSVG